MKRLGIIITFLTLVAGLAGCGTYDAAAHDAATAATNTVPVKSTGADAFTCINAALNSMGFTIVDANKDAGLVKAEKKRDTIDLVTVSIYDDPARKVPVMRVTVDSNAVRHGVDWRTGNINAGPRLVATETPADVKANVQQLLTTCGK